MPQRGDSQYPLSDVISLPPPPWALKGICRELTEEEFEIFYPEPGEGKVSTNTKVVAAKRLCHTCPVEDECLEFALENNIRHGVYGGTSGNERVKYFRAKAKGFNVSLRV